MGDSQASENKGGSQQSTSNGIPMPPFTATLSGEDMNSAGTS